MMFLFLHCIENLLRLNFSSFIQSRKHRCDIQCSVLYTDIHRSDILVFHTFKKTANVHISLALQSVCIHFFFIFWKRNERYSLCHPFSFSASCLPCSMCDIFGFNKMFPYVHHGKHSSSFVPHQVLRSM